MACGINRPRLTRRADTPHSRIPTVGKRGGSYSRITGTQLDLKLEIRACNVQKVKHMKTLMIAAAAASLISLTACGTNPSNQQIGTATGAVLGGAAGSALGGGTLGTVGGAAAGAVIGNEVGKRRDQGR
jgi:osmotically inducible lipoprotein OsmB